MHGNGQRSSQHDAHVYSHDSSNRSPGGKSSNLATQQELGLLSRRWRKRSHIDFSDPALCQPLARALIGAILLSIIDVDRLPRVPKSWLYGYSSELAIAADRFVDLFFARGWKRRWNPLISRQGARRMIFRRDRI